jgi:ankyrin repeat protein
MSKTVEDLIGDNDIDELDDNGKTRLIQILQFFTYNDNDAFTLIRAGCDLDVLCKINGMAAIHWACIHGKIKVVVEMIERNVKLDARDYSGRTYGDMTCFMYACSQKHYDCAFAVMDAGGTVNLMKMTYTTIALPSLVMQGVERRLQEINQVRESFKNWSPTLVEEEILPFIYCENNLKYLKNFGEPKKLIENGKKQGQKRKHSE